MKKTVSGILGRAGGISLYRKRGSEYMRQIGRSGAMKRSRWGGGRPKACTFSEKLMAGNKSEGSGKAPENIRGMLKILRKRQIIRSFEK